MSLLPVLSGTSDEHRSEAVSVFRNFSLIRTASHKCVDHGGAGVELYDLENDPEELHNIADGEMALVRQLRSRMAKHLAAQKGHR